MSRGIIVIALLALSCVQSTSASIASVQMAPFDPVQGFAPPSIVFDAENGQAFNWDKDLPCGANRASVIVKFDKAYPNLNAAYLPVAKIWLHSRGSDGTSGQWMTAVVKAPTDAFQLNALVWLEKVTGTKSEGPGTAAADLSKPLRVDISWTPAGVMSVDFGGEFIKHISTTRHLTDIGLSVTWSKFEFIDLKVGRAGLPDPRCVS